MGLILVVVGIIVLIVLFPDTLRGSPDKKALYDVTVEGVGTFKATPWGISEAMVEKAQELELEVEVTKHDPTQEVQPRD